MIGLIILIRLKEKNFLIRFFITRAIKYTNRNIVRNISPTNSIVSSTGSSSF